MRSEHVKSTSGHADQWLTGGMIVSMCLWGLSWPSSKVLTHYCSPINLTTYRYILVVVSLFPALFFIPGKFRLSLAALPFILISGVLLALYSFFTFRGLHSGTAGAGGVMVTILNPVFAYFIGIVLSRRPPSRFESIGLSLGLCAGLILLRAWENYHMVFEAGNLYFLLAAFTWAVMSKFTSRAARFGTSMAFSFWQYLVCLVCMCALTDYNEFSRLFITADARMWTNLIFSSVIVTTLATTVYFYTTTRLGAEKASSFLFLVPFAAALSAWALLGEHIQIHTLSGGFTGILAVYFINRKPRKKNSLESTEFLPPEN
jgi:drug/metabolite transporter (DMT)-like permease